MDNFKKLPKPIIKIIFSQLTCKDITIARTCKLFHHILSTNNLIIIQMMQNGSRVGRSLKFEFQKKRVLCNAKEEVNFPNLYQNITFSNLIKGCKGFG